MGVLLQDGRRSGHLGWAIEAIGADVAHGVVISPMHTPRISVPRHRSGRQVAEAVRAAGGEVIFDPGTHARLLPTTDDLMHYNTWGLWGPAGVGLDTDERRLEHLERVFDRQLELGVEALAPTLSLDNPVGRAAEYSLRTTELARGLKEDAWQSLAGRRSFWRGGSDLDAYVGQLVQTRAPVWVITVVNEVVHDNQPDLADTGAFSGLLRTIHSLSERSRVILSYADFAGLSAVAAGADSLGSGWDRGMRYFDPQSFQVRSAPGIRIPASYVTQGRLAAVLRRDTADAIARLDAGWASELRGGPMPPDDSGERVHHLGRLTDVVRLAAAEPNRADRVHALREFYEQAAADFEILRGQLPSQILTESQVRRWNSEPYAVLRAYATAEGFWSAD